MPLSGLRWWMAAVGVSGGERPFEVGQSRLLVQRPAVLGLLDLDAALGDGEGGVLGLPVELLGYASDGGLRRLLIVAGFKVDLRSAERGADGVREAGEGAAGPPEGVGLLYGRLGVDLHAELPGAHGDRVWALAEGDLLEGLGGVLLHGRPGLFLAHPPDVDVADADAALDAAVPSEKVEDREPGEQEARGGGHHGDPTPQGVLGSLSAILSAARPAAARRRARSLLAVATRLPVGPRPAFLAYFLQASAPPTVRPAPPFRDTATTRKR